jgi:uncharacterized membrane protein YfcA
VRRLAYGSVPGAIAGSLLADHVRVAVVGADEYLKVAIGIAICISATLLLMSMFYDVRNMKQRIHTFFGLEQHIVGYTIGTGLFGGFLVGLTSVGAGSVMLVLLLIVYNTSTRKLVGTDIVHATILLFTAGVVHLFTGNIDWKLVIGLLIGSIPGVLIGSRLAHRVSRTALKTVLILVLFFLGGQLIYRFFF